MDEQNKSKTIGDDLVVSTIKPRRVGGTWLIGSVAGHRFTALIFPKHARERAWEIGDSSISKLCLHRLKDREVVFAWERGPYRRAEDQ